MSRLIENIRDGKRTAEIIDDTPDFAFRIRDIDILRQTLLSEKYTTENRDLYVSYLFGASGAGKTRSIYQAHDPREICRITNYRAGNGIPLSDWEKQQPKIEAVLNVHIARIKRGKSRQRILLHTVSGNRDLSELLYWKDAYLSGKSFELVLGESLLGRETVNLAKAPHMLLGGSTGSGKSVLLKLLIMQCVKKGAAVYIADFKGGVDFPAVWHEKCRMAFEESELLDTLTGIADELERRKVLLRSGGYANIDEHNKNAVPALQRIVFACDEVAEVLDKSGLSKEGKDLVSQIEGKLSVIARQGRAFGIHLILATQRPDAMILTGQIRNNIVFRVCGRADNVLSQIILDNTTASEQIPKDAQGRFITHDGTVFQGYLFDENRAFK